MDLANQVPGTRHRARLMRRIRSFVGIHDTGPVPIVLADNPHAHPVLRGRGPYWRSPRTGLEVQPSQKMKLTREGYVPGNRRIEVGALTLELEASVSDDNHSDYKYLARMLPLEKLRTLAAGNDSVNTHLASRRTKP